MCTLSPISIYSFHRYTRVDQQQNISHLIAFLDFDKFCWCIMFNFIYNLLNTQTQSVVQNHHSSATHQTLRLYLSVVKQKSTYFCFQLTISMLSIHKYDLSAVDPEPLWFYYLPDIIFTYGRNYISGQKNIREFGSSYYTR